MYIREPDKEDMPLYDCMLLAKPHVKKEALMDLVARVSKHVFRRNGVIREIKSFGNVHLGYGIKKLDGRFYKVCFCFLWYLTVNFPVLLG